MDPVDILEESVPRKRPPATITAKVVINGYETQIRTTPEEAEKNGWEVVSGGAGPAHKARTAPDPVTPDSPEELTVDELRQIASDLEIDGRSSMNKAELIAAIEAASA